MRLRYTVRLDLRYAAQDRHRAACTPKSSRCLVYVFRLTSFLLVYVPPTLPYAATVREALPLTIHVYDSRLTIYDSVLVYRNELLRCTTTGSKKPCVPPMTSIQCRPEYLLQTRVMGPVILITNPAPLCQLTTTIIPRFRSPTEIG